MNIISTVSDLITSLASIKSAEKGEKGKGLLSAIGNLRKFGKGKESIVKIATKRRNAEDNRTWQEKLIEEGNDLEDQGCLICSL